MTGFLRHDIRTCSQKTILLLIEIELVAYIGLGPIWSIKAVKMWGCTVQPRNVFMAKGHKNYTIYNTVVKGFTPLSLT